MIDFLTAWLELEVFEVVFLTTALFFVLLPDVWAVAVDLLATAFFAVGLLAVIEVAGFFAVAVLDVLEVDGFFATKDLAALDVDLPLATGFLAAD